MRLLLTGVAGIGKTTVLRNALDRLEGIRCSGFYTEERRHGGERVGFKIFTLDGREATLAWVDRVKGPRIGRYSVRVKEFEALVLSQIDPEETPADLYVIDEIGNMELLSRRFRDKLVDLLARPTHLLGSVAKKGRGFIDEIKRRNDVELIEVTKENRDQLPQELARRILKEIGAC